MEMKTRELVVAWPYLIFSSLKRVFTVASDENANNISRPELPSNDKLKKIRELHNSGIISKSEYAAIKSLLTQEENIPKA
jgi:hypothetical protein